MIELKSLFRLRLADDKPLLQPHCVHGVTPCPTLQSSQVPSACQVSRSLVSRRKKAGSHDSEYTDQPYRKEGNSSAHKTRYIPLSHPSRNQATKSILSVRYFHVNTWLCRMRNCGFLPAFAIGWRSSMLCHRVVQHHTAFAPCPNMWHSSFLPFSVESIYSTTESAQW